MKLDYVKVFSSLIASIIVFSLNVWLLLLSWNYIAPIYLTGILPDKFISIPFKHLWVACFFFSCLVSLIKYYLSTKDIKEYYK